MLHKPKAPQLACRNIELRDRAARVRERPCTARRRSGRPGPPLMSLRRDGGGFVGAVVEDRRQPALGLFQLHALAGGVIRHLVTLDLGDAEVVGVNVNKCN